jgi:hypothetical protein
MSAAWATQSDAFRVADGAAGALLRVARADEGGLHGTLLMEHHAAYINLTRNIGVTHCNSMYILYEGLLTSARYWVDPNDDMVCGSHF